MAISAGTDVNVDKTTTPELYNYIVLANRRFMKSPFVRTNGFVAFYSSHSTPPLKFKPKAKLGLNKSAPLTFLNPQI